MEDAGRRTNKALLLLSFLFCIVCGAFITQSSAYSPIESSDAYLIAEAGDSAVLETDTGEEISPGELVLEDPDGQVIIIEEDEGPSSGTSAEEESVPDDGSEASSKEKSEDAAPSPEADREPESKGSGKESAAPEAEPQVPSRKTFASSDVVSPQASQGIWVSQNGTWYFLVDNVSYHGWLHDTDGHIYYFGEDDGIMKTGWQDIQGKRYYFDEDGILQSGNILLDGQAYHLLEDGSLAGTEPAASSEAEAGSVSAEEKAKASPAPEEPEEPEEKQEAVPADENKEQKDAKTEKTADKLIALTFDDGPDAFTDRLLDCLEENDARATFFLVGSEIENFPGVIQRMDEIGCEIGNHTYNHTSLSGKTPQEISDEIGSLDQLLLDTVGHGGTLVRPPYGDVDQTVRDTVGTPMILWSVDTEDWDLLDAGKVAESVLSQAEDGAVVLLHDIHSTTVDAAEYFVPELIRQGYRLVTVSELAAAKGVELVPGNVYGGFTDE